MCVGRDRTYEREREREAIMERRGRYCGWRERERSERERNKMRDPSADGEKG